MFKVKVIDTRLFDLDEVDNLTLLDKPPLKYVVDNGVLFERFYSVSGKNYNDVLLGTIIQPLTDERILELAGIKYNPSSTSPFDPPDEQYDFKCKAAIKLARAIEKELFGD